MKRKKRKLDMNKLNLNAIQRNADKVMNNIKDVNTNRRYYRLYCSFISR